MHYDVYGLVGCALVRETMGGILGYVTSFFGVWGGFNKAVHGECIQV